MATHQPATWTAAQLTDEEREQLKSAGFGDWVANVDTHRGVRTDGIG